MSIGTRIKQAREQMGLSRNEFAKIIGVTPSAVSNYENGISSPKEPVMFSILSALKCDANYLFQDDIDIKNIDFKFTIDEQEHIKKYRDLDSHGKKVVDVVLDEEYNRILSYEGEQDNRNEYFIAYYDLPASAGTGAFLHTDTTQKLKVPETPTTLRADFAVRVSGDSMEPKYYDGDILLVEEKPDIEMGQIGIFVLNGTGYVKKKGENGLISLNPKYDPIEPETFDDCRCIGKVIGKL